MIFLYLINIALFGSCCSQDETSFSEQNYLRVHFSRGAVLGKAAAELRVASEHWEDQGWQQKQRENQYHMKGKDLEVPNAEGS